MPKLPRASGDKHITAFKRAGWKVNHIEGSHHILIKEGSNFHLSIPVHKGRTLGIGLLKKLIVKADLTNEEYIHHFYGKKKR
ncbi:type II toxin-antitoxin system HicA family toxin [ANME-1 cluster archaeon GoMg4]|nr:type II toxin-antitoxin system HicA family toxin [ANME-1 cluster archaeon GoMg4]